MSGEWLQNAQFEDISMGTRLGLKLTIEESRMWAAQNGVSEEERLAASGDQAEAEIRTSMGPNLGFGAAPREASTSPGSAQED